MSGALSHIGDRVRQVAYLDAFVPGDGDTVLGMAGRPASAAITLGEQWLIPPPAREYDDPAEAEFASARRTPHPARCFTEPARLPRPLEDYPCGRTYVKATADSPDAPGAAAFWAAAEHARSSPAWDYREIATNHMIPVNRPQELADLLLELA